MLVYVDSSVVLRIILEQPSPLAEWDQIGLAVSSTLLAVECHRTLDRYWREDRLSDSGLATKRTETEVILRRFDSVLLDDAVLRGAAKPFPTLVRTLDALHLSSAIIDRTAQPPDERPITFATHDLQLARAARAMHFEVIGA